MKLTKLLAIIATSLISLCAFAAGEKIVVSSISGDGTATVSVNGEVMEVYGEETITEGSTVKTDAKTTVRIVFSNGTVVTVAPGSEVVLTSFSQTGTVPPDAHTLSSEPAGTNSTLAIQVKSGTVGVSANLNEGSKIDVSTPAGAVTSTQPATFTVSVDGAAATTKVAEGTVVTTTATGGVATPVTAGEKSVARQGSTETITAKMTATETATTKSEAGSTGLAPAPAQSAPAISTPPSTADIAGDNPAHISPNSPEN